MRRKHEMPFGAECRDDGSVRFRLWAPNAKTVSLRVTGASPHGSILEEEPRELPMSRAAAGWYELVTNSAGHGSRYQFVIDGRQAVPDPASRFQPEGVHGSSEVFDPRAYQWRDANWRGRQWNEAVIYELHVGTFSSEGTYAGAEKKLDYLADLGVTAVELMPVSSFPGQRNWGYDGVLPFAPTANYGRPEELKQFIDAAHARNLMVLLDVVYNHFGPEGNYLWLYASQFFTDRHHTPWGQAINFDGPESRTVRDYFIHNALYWLEEYRFDGLRLDAVHAIKDDSSPDILTELAEGVRERFAGDRIVHLVLENDNNAAHYLREYDRRDGIPGKTTLYDAQWNDDIHHALHVLLTGEKEAYYSDYEDRPAVHLGRCLAEGFSYQGEKSQYRNGEVRGEPSRDLPPTRFVSFLQNHDQVGNRAFGERIGKLADPEALKAAMAILLLAPSPPLLFMGEEFAATTPFLFSCDFGPDLAAKVSAGRRAEFPNFMVEGESEIPDPNREETFLRSKLDWASIEQDRHRSWLIFCKSLLACRRAEIVPRIKDIAAGQAHYKVLGESAVSLRWPFFQGGDLELRANLGNVSLQVERADGRILYSTVPDHKRILEAELPPYSTVWFLT
ncbi:MAG: malto-oligosyltrehalose trehalohydrolase [Terriglobales bacterium]